ncbi:MAG TPA: winged helix-turn-helix domain-containing protein [Candidatus Paceibacterota bacterium]|nr:winged helix-turn-helix domain-containing protein [Candidatus Paceibacterota bacterium]
MSNKKYVMVSLDDEKLSVLAEVLSNKTAKKILEFLAEREASESEIAESINLAPNTVNYNIKKLLESGLIEKSSNFLWSLRGKKMLKYRIANKKILISPKSSNSTKFIATFVITSIAAIFIKLLSNSFVQKASNKSLNVASDFSVVAGQNLSKNLESVAYSETINLPSFAEEAVCFSQQSGILRLFSEPWAWFVAGALTVTVIYFLLGIKWKK